MAIPLIGPLLATKFGKPIAIIGGIALLLGLVFLLGRCSGDNDDVAAQVEQTTASSEAIADAAEHAIETIGERTATDAAIDQAVEDAVQEIENAESPDAVRAAVVNGLCRSSAHRNDPACMNAD